MFDGSGHADGRLMHCRFPWTLKSGPKQKGDTKTTGYSCDRFDDKPGLYQPVIQALSEVVVVAEEGTSTMMEAESGEAPY